MFDSKRTDLLRHQRSFSAPTLASYEEVKPHRPLGKSSIRMLQPSVHTRALQGCIRPQPGSAQCPRSTKGTHDTQAAASSSHFTQCFAYRGVLPLGRPDGTSRPSSPARVAPSTCPGSSCAAIALHSSMRRRVSLLTGGGGGTIWVKTISKWL